MAELPKIRDAHPVLRSSPIATSAAGTQSIGRALGQFGKMLFEKAESIQTEESAAMYVQSRDQIEHTMNQARIGMVQNPGAAKKIAENSAFELDAIKKSAILNKKHHEQLSYDVRRSDDAINLEATKTSIHHSRKMGKFSFLSSFDTTLKAYQDALMTDHKQAEHMHDNMVSTIRGLVYTDVLSPHEGASALKSMSHITDSVNSYHQALSNLDENLNAEQINSAHASMLSTDTLKNAGMPVNQSTAYLYHDSLDDHSKEQAFADATLHKRPSIEAFLNMKPAAQDKWNMLWKGSSKALGLVNSGDSYFKVVDRLEELKAKGGDIGLIEKGEKGYLDYFVKRLENGEYLSVIAETPAGSAIIQEFSKDEAANYELNTNEEGNLTPDGQARLKNIYNEMIDKTRTIGNAMHIPNQYINPFPESKVKEIESGFMREGNPSNTIQGLDYLNPINRAHMAMQMKNPNQQQAALTVGYLEGAKVDAFRNKMIMYSQEVFGKDLSSLKIGKEEGIPDPSLRVLVEPYISEVAKYKARLPGGRIQSDAFRKNAMDYVRGESLANSDIAQKGAADYAKDFKENIDKAYQFITGTDFQFNKKDLPMVDESDANYLARYAKKEAVKLQRMRGNDAEIDDLFVTVTPDRVVIVVDSNNTVMWHEEYQGTLLDHAKHKTKEEVDTENKKNLEGLRKVKRLERVIL